MGDSNRHRVAIRKLRNKVRLGDATASNNIAATYCLHEGLGVGKDRGHAFRWYFRAAKQGVVRAQFNVGLCYRDGDGVKASNRKAREWLQRAARRGHPPARKVLTGML